MEIERKFLVKKLPENLESFSKSEISQSYISLSPTIRIRQADDNYFLTLKGEGHISREELEIKINSRQYASLLKKTENNTVKKTRYFIPLNNNLTAELDIYKENLKGLITVEVEFQSLKEAELFLPPNWFGDDISQNKLYKNTNLSIYGVPPNIF